MDGGGDARFVTPRAAEAGFTLIELMISLALFALIAVAGAAMVDGVLSVQARTAGRLDRLAELQRAMVVLGNDLSQQAGGPVAGQGSTLLFSRPLPRALGLPQPIRYALADHALVRVAGDKGPRQTVLTGVSAAAFRFYRGRQDGWIDRWPPSRELEKSWPLAIEISLTIAGEPGRPAGTLRKLVALPVQP